IAIKNKLHPFIHHSSRIYGDLCSVSKATGCRNCLRDNVIICCFVITINRPVKAILKDSEVNTQIQCLDVFPGYIKISCIRWENGWIDTSIASDIEKWKVSEVAKIKPIGICIGA